MTYALDANVQALATAFGRDVGWLEENTRKITTDATRAPLPTDDESQGYAVGSRWLWQGQEWVRVVSGWQPVITGSPAEARDSLGVAEAIPTAAFGSGAAGVNAAFDYAVANGRGRVFLSAPVNAEAPMLLPSRVTLENPHGFTTTMLPGCRTAYGNRIDENLFTVSSFVGLTDPVIDGGNLGDAWHGVYFAGAANCRIVRPRIFNLTATATGSDGAGHGGNDGGNAAYAGYDDATAIFLTTHMVGVAPKRSAEWVIEHPEITGVANGIICTTHPNDTAGDGAGFGLLTYPNIDGFTGAGVAFRYGEQNVIMHGRVSTSHPAPYLVHVGDTVATLINVGTDGVMFTSFVRFETVAAGQVVSQIAVAGTNLLTGALTVGASETAAQFADRVAAAINANTGTSGYSATRSTRRPSVFIWTSAGAKVVASTPIVVTSDVAKVVASGTTADTANIDYVSTGVTGLRGPFGYPEGHDGSDTIGILVTDQSSVEIFNSGGNGPINRVWFAQDPANLMTGGATAKARTNHYRAADGMTYFGGGFKSAPRVEATTASGLSVAPATAGDWSASYTNQSIQRIPNGATDIIMAYLDFTPTFTTASGALRFNLPPEIAVLVSSGNQMFLNVEQIKTNTVPASVLGMPRFRLTSGATFGEVIWPKSDGTSAIWSVSHLTSGVNAQLRLFGQIPMNR